jgi:hypothetical protein
MNYIDGILWYASWPIVLWVAYKFVMINLYHHAKMERLEMLEKRFGAECYEMDSLLQEKLKKDNKGKR